MKVTRKIVLISALAFFIATISGVVLMTTMEQVARMALPPEQQTAESIEKLYDGAVCLSCDFFRIFIAMLGTVVMVGTLLVWGVSEAGRQVFLKLWKS